MSHNKPAKPIPEPPKDEVTLAAMAWAEFLYDEYILAKHKQLLLDKRDITIRGNEPNEGNT